jgi:hypothetical protein
MRELAENFVCAHGKTIFLFAWGPHPVLKRHFLNFVVVGPTVMIDSKDYVAV